MTPNTEQNEKLVEFTIKFRFSVHEISDGCLSDTLEALGNQVNYEVVDVQVK